MRKTGRVPRSLLAAILWSALCPAITLLGLDRTLAEAVEVDARSANLAVWKVYGGGQSATAFAIGERHFLTCAHVIKDFSDHGAIDVFINRYGSNDRRRFRINYGHVALTLVQDIALFTTQERVDRYFAPAETGATEGESGLRAMGHPLGLSMETLHQSDPISYQNDFQLEVPADRTTRGGLSGSPVFRNDGKVVGMHCQGSDNMLIAVKLEHLRRFVDGDLPWTACRDFPSVGACIERAKTQTRELAEAGDLVAQYQLGRDDGYLDKDPVMLRRAAEGGFAPAQVALGRWLREREQWAESTRWYRQSAEQGDPGARYGLGLAYYRGRGVVRDRVRAFELMFQSARSGYAVAEYGVGLSYEDGHGTQRDAAKSRRWIQRAADKGLEEAREKLKSLDMAPTAEAIEHATVMWAIKRANVRIGPGKSYAKVDLLEVGDEVRVVERTGNWFRLQPTSRQPDRLVYGPMLSTIKPRRRGQVVARSAMSGPAATTRRRRRCLRWRRGLPLRPPAPGRGWRGPRRAHPRRW